MEPSTPARPNRKPLTVVRKVAITLVVGTLAYLLTEQALAAEKPLAVMASIFLGGVAFVTQFLIDIESRINQLELQQEEHVHTVKKMTEDNFARIGQATALLSNVESSHLSNELLVKIASNAARIGPDTQRLAKSLANEEIQATSKLLDEIGRRHTAVYEGEDRDWLLGLTRHSAHTIQATSLTTIDAGGHGFTDGGLWLSDLGQRYVDAQRRAIDRGVRIQRLFIIDRPELTNDQDFIEVYRMQHSYRMDVRVLDPSTISGSPRNSFSDFIIFDAELSYETTPAAHAYSSGRPSILLTSLVSDPDRVAERIEQFKHLWSMARQIEW